LAVAAPRFEAVAGQRRQVSARCGRFEAIEFQSGRALKCRKCSDALPGSKISRPLVSEADDHI
jgi:hypothetical protein